MRAHNSKTSLVAALLALSCVTACSEKKAPAEKPRAAELTPVPDGHPSLTPLPDPELQAGHVGRAPRRINVAQLRSSILTTTGRQWSQLDRLAASLGQADYALVNSEATEPNLVFAKFLEDGAREVCLATAQADLDQSNQAARILSPEVPTQPADLTKLPEQTVRQNLTYLSTRFWGQPLSEQELDVWAESFKNIAARAEVAKKRREAWGAICIALMTDPRFTTY